MFPRILIAEDEPVARRILHASLANLGYEVEATCDGVGALAGLEASDAPALAILDWMMPGLDGLDVCRQIRATRDHGDLYVLLLSARADKEDLVAALDAGADDYLVKPFALVELQARVRALLRRYQGHSDNLMQVDDLQLNLSSQQVYLQQQPVEVTPKEFAILARLIMRAGQTVNRELLQQDLYTWQDDLGSNTLEVHIHNLRRKLGKDRIRTVRGIGYRLEPSS